MLPSPRGAVGRQPVARQPIWTSGRKLAGHEYLYRSRSGLPAGVDSWRSEWQDLASAFVLHSVAAAGRTEGPGLTFVNITRAFVVDARPLPAPTESLVLEIVESVPGDEQVLAGLARLRALGYRLALDDYVASSDQLAMLPTVEFVKIDIRALPTLPRDVLASARRFGAKLVAEWLETAVLVDHAIRLEFDLLQGDALGAAATC